MGYSDVEKLALIPQLENAFSGKQRRKKALEKCSNKQGDKILL